MDKSEKNRRRREKYQNDPAHKAKVAARGKEYLYKVKNDPELLERKKAKRRELYRKRTEEEKEKRRAYNKSYLASDDQLSKKRIRRKLRTQERLEWAIEIFGGVCMQCGLRDDPIVYDFHHVDPATKNFTIAARISYIQIDKLIEELKKCVLLCSRCHRKVTYEVEVLKCGLPNLDWDISKLKVNKCSDKWRQDI
jgi:hypothetical protein